jgi:hypothetical protein
MKILNDTPQIDGLNLVPFPPPSAADLAAPLPHWVCVGRPLYRWLERPLHCTPRVVKFAACYALLLILAVML